MITKQELWDRIAQGEGEQTEFKRGLEHPDRVAAEIVALANSTRGGWILFGVDDEGQAVGVPDPAALERDLINICRQNCLPSLLPQVELVPVGEQNVLVLKIDGPDRPYRTQRGVYYVRVGATHRQATQQELVRIFQLRGALQYDETPVLSTTLDDLDLAYLSRYYERQFKEPLDETGVPLSMLLQNMRLAASVGETTHLTLAGLLLFGHHPQRHLRYTRLTAVCFAGSEPDEGFIRDHRDIEGKLAEIIEGAVAFLQANTRITATMSGLRREDHPQYALPALREAVVNAVAHRDYGLTGRQIRLFVLDDHVTVHSPGRLPNTVTLETIRYGVHYERNPRLCAVLSHLGYMREIGTGIPRMIRLTRQLAGQEPEFVLRGEEFSVTIPAATLDREPES